MPPSADSTERIPNIITIDLDRKVAEFYIENRIHDSISYDDSKT